MVIRNLYKKYEISEKIMTDLENFALYFFRISQKRKNEKHQIHLNRSPHKKFLFSKGMRDDFLKNYNLNEHLLTSNVCSPIETKI